MLDPDRPPCWSHEEGARRGGSPSSAIAYAAYLGHLDGGRGLRVLDNPWSQILGITPGRSLETLRVAHTQGLLDLLVAGNVVDVSFSALRDAA